MGGNGIAGRGARGSGALRETVMWVGAGLTVSGRLFGETGSVGWAGGEEKAFFAKRILEGTAFYATNPS